MAHISNKANQPRQILLGFLVVIISILSVGQLTVTVKQELSGTYFIVTSDITSDDIRDNSNSVYRIRTDGTELKRIARAVELTEPTHSQITDVACDYTSQRLAVAFGNLEINGFYTMDVGGANPVHEQPSNGLVHGISDVAFSPDGEYLILSKEIRDDELEDSHFVLMRSDIPTNQFRLIKGDIDTSYHYPSLSHDDNQLAYVTHSGHESVRYANTLTIADENAVNSQVIYETSSRIRSISWSPDGQWILAEIGSQIYKMRADGSDITQMTTTPNGATSPQWSPDGTQISFVVRSSFPNRHHLMTIGADGQNMQKIVTFDREIVNECWM